ncbi:unnamed protein product [Rhizophagus irregularis]|uniref:Protein kinase domain-containing protein n=1 Tax=Rhizophagus irregularis TaxID=588596 RepID=A0A915Z520_9GLOM|nr:unnamed protein product [Rhizophagus irregularis]
MDEIKLSDDVFEQIKDFNHFILTEEQKSLIDKLITDEELKERYKEKEWIEYDEFEDVEYLAKGGFGTTFKAIWKDGHIISGWDFNINKLRRESKTKVALKCLHNSQDITADFLKEIESNILAVYTSRLLDFKNLPEPKNADNNDLEYSDSLKMDFTKIDINSKDERN